MILQLQDALNAEQCETLASRYAERLQCGPTRPHPHMPRTGVLGRLAYRLSTVVDRTMGVLDSRAVHPTPVALAATVA